jgi:sugar O-acyltransferase (sialic acid O-acetyltransferase NeuD family)
MRRLIGVYGAGGCGRGIMPLLRAKHSNIELVFIDDQKTSCSVNGHDVLTWTDFLERDTRSRAVSIAISSSKTRQSLAEKCDNFDVMLIETRAENVVQMDDVIIGDGACLSPFVTLTSNIRIGRCFHANLYSYIEHDCIVGDFVTLAPGVKLNGSVIVGDYAYIGAGAVIRQGVAIGTGAVVGMGSVVTKDVPAGVTVVGNPAKPLIKD